MWDVTFYSVEQAYQWRKCTFHHKTNKAKTILKLSDPYRIKAVGTFTTAPEWDRKKAEFMLELLLIKAKVCPLFKELLINSFPKVLVEDTANDYWGRGANGEGANTLGCLLIHIRSILLSNS